MKPRPIKLPRPGSGQYWEFQEAAAKEMLVSVFGTVGDHAGQALFDAFSDEGISNFYDLRPYVIFEEPW